MYDNAYDLDASNPYKGETGRNYMTEPERENPFSNVQINLNFSDNKKKQKVSMPLNN